MKNYQAQTPQNLALTKILQTNGASMCELLWNALSVQIFRQSIVTRII